MIRVHRVLAVTLVIACMVACGDTVNYNPATTSDPTPPDTNVLVRRAGAPDLEVQNRVGPSANVNANLGDFSTKAKRDFSVLATATDRESGIKHIKLSVTRTVCYVASNGAIAQAYSGTDTRKEATYTDQTQAPTQASVGDTGIFDNTDAAVATPTDDNLLVWVNANQVRAVGAGVSTKWGMETTNFAGRTTYSDVITVFGGNVTCVTP